MIRAIVVDDEPLARRGVTARLARAPDIELVRECSNGREAIEAIRSLGPDLVFLDVQMPGLGGFDVVEAVGPAAMPSVVFITAHEQHAIQAFEAEALDYLLKPIDDDRFRQALDRVRRRVAERRRGAEPGRESRLLVKERGRVEVVETDRIGWVEARGDYVRLHAENGRRLLLRETMTGLASRLDPARFVRIHRSTIVNRLRIVRADFHADREWSVTLDDGSTHRVGRRYRTTIRSIREG